MAEAAADAQRASTDVPAWVPNHVFGDIKSSQTIVGNGGLNVIRVKSIDLKMETLTLQGGAEDEFVINVTDKVKLDEAAIRVAGALVPSRVLFNRFDKGDVKLDKASQLAGTILAPDGEVEVMGEGGTVFGAVIAGKEIQLTEGATISLR